MNVSQKDVRSYLTYVGSRNPDVTGGFNNRFYYKNFDLAISCNFVFGQLMTRSPFYNPAQTNPGQNYTTEMNKVWSPSNTSGTYPSLTGNLQADGSAWGDWDENPRSVQGLLLDHGQFPDKRQPVQQPRHLEQEDQLLPREQHPAGILLPAANHTQLHMAGLRVHFEARNPLVIATNYDGYFDPETYGNIYAQPMARTYSVGLNITF